MSGVLDESRLSVRVLSAPGHSLVDDMKNAPLDSTDLTWLGGLARALLRDPHAADDLVQEVRLAAAEGPTLAGAPRRAWLSVVARRLAARRFRSEARRADREELAARPESLPDSAELVERAEIAEQVTAAARSLPEPYRRTILLRFLEGRSAEEIARDEGRPVGTVRWRVRKGLELLRAELVQRHGRDWSSWCVLLTPLARVGGDVGLATAGATGGIAGWVASWTVMKSLALALVVCCVGIWFAFRTASDPPADAVARLEADAGSAVVAEKLSHTTRAPVPERVDASSNAREDVAENPIEPSTELAGTVVDENGQPIADATVFLVERATDGRAFAEVETDRVGAFRLAEGLTEHDLAACELGAFANGFLRKVVAAPSPGVGASDLVLVLERGRTLSGRVVDEDGLPVPDVELMAYTAYANVSHVSPTQMVLRARSRTLTGGAVEFGSSRARTDGRGEVSFTGLPVGELTVVSVDPGWTLEDPARVADGETYVVWTAKRRLGVRLVVRDVTGRPPEDLARATFRFEVTYENGEVRDFGKWVGRGRGEVSFVVSEAALPGFSERVVTGARFYGTVRTNDDDLTEWRAEALEDPGGVSGTVEVRVELGARTVPEAPRPAVVAGVSTLELDVRYADATPFEGALDVTWTPVGRLRDGDSTRAERIGVGRYEVELPAGEHGLEVRDRAASGSLPAWTDEQECRADERARVFVTLPRGGSARILRPEGWSGTWFVRATFRFDEDEEWRGGLGYGTDEDALELTVLHACEWRFELRRDSALDAEVLVRTALVSENELAIVD